MALLVTPVKFGYAIICYIYHIFEIFVDVSVVEWYNQCLPYTGPGFDSRPIQSYSGFFSGFSGGVWECEVFFCLYAWVLVFTVEGVRETLIRE